MEASKLVRWGILGTGWVAQRFVADLRRVPGAEAAAIASRSLERARRVAERFGIARAHGSYEALATDPTVDVVYVASEHPQHAAHACLLLENGKHVLCEKPFTVTAAEARSVADTARARRLFCMEAMWTRFLPAARAAKRLIDNGRIGVPTLLTADFGLPTRAPDTSRFFDPTRGGGALLDRGVYPISLAVWFLGKPVEVRAVAHRRASGVDETISAVLAFSDQRAALVSASLSIYSGNQVTI